MSTDQNPVRGPFVRQGPRKADDPSLRRAVVGKRWCTFVAELRCSVDDPPVTTLNHSRKEYASDEKCAAEMNVDHPIPGRYGQLHERSSSTNPGTIDQDADMTQSLRRLGRLRRSKAVSRAFTASSMWSKHWAVDDGTLSAARVRLERLIASGELQNPFVPARCSIIPSLPKS
jgi:hypothetical protein